MFTRNEDTYYISDFEIKGILESEANPIRVISTIIPDNSKVLDIGAGNGVLARFLKSKYSDIIIDGVEPSDIGSELSKSFYRRFYKGFFEDFKDDILKEKYDFIVLSDVIEHIADPFKFICEISYKIDDDTKLLLSIPNVAFGSVRICLLSGVFEYVDSGLLEKTHLRFFTLETAKRMFSLANLHIEKECYLMRDFFETEISLNNLKPDFFVLKKIYNDELASVYQFIFLLSKRNTVPEKRIFGKRASNFFIRYLKLFLSNSPFLNFLKKRAKFK